MQNDPFQCCTFIYIIILMMDVMSTLGFDGAAARVEAHFNSFHDTRNISKLSTLCCTDIHKSGN